ncbi:putative Fe(III) ABC-type transporter, permease protein [Desulfamplus magnetovallimortis]|uniref:Putative Fe(III) ABC-type transporter, permease protein n=1 Tax=Desulfamplus magnetovallimortis TaxID=1246637 RepID=A0A1W1HCT1_9BACT|nr:iron ABC transporter permease [Desulfamplus magnetovallimortis]SLM30243.1 putative Fe(III) ABC-type transporter, permease protein [Desulfamplus magnetovallimortis]
MFSDSERKFVERVEYLGISLLASLLVGLILLSASMGYIKIPFHDVARVVLSAIYDNTFSISDNTLLISGIPESHSVIVMDVRLPRILTCAFVGAALALSGVIFQGILLNPLADPYTLGVSAGAAFGACTAILLNLGAAFVSVPLFAFLGAIATLFFVIYLSYTGKNRASVLSSNSLILSGIIIAAILSAAISFLKYLADEQVAIIIFWLMGSFASKTWIDVFVTFLFLVSGFAVSMMFARELNLISLGERSASSLGVDTRKVTLILLITASMLAAISVSVSGIIGFVGLLVPHMVRFITGPDNRRLIPLSMFSGAILLLGADTVTRAVLPHEIPIGILTALIGGPLFCWIFKRGNLR